MKKTAREAVDAYYQEAGSWASDKVQALQRSARIAWTVAAIAVAVAVVQGLAILMLTPLKTVVPYTLMVDRTTGFVQALAPLDPGQISPDKALVQSMLVQYVIARESYDVAVLRANYQKVGQWSADQAREDYLNLMQVSNPDSPQIRYPRDTVLEARVRSVSPLDGQSALVRFETVRRDQGGQASTTQPWVAVVQYRFVGEPMSVEDRFLNPLGFQVVKYRIDPEALAPAEPVATPLEPVDAVPIGEGTAARPEVSQ